MTTQMKSFVWNEIMYMHGVHEVLVTDTPFGGEHFGTSYGKIRV